MKLFGIRTPSTTTTNSIVVAALLLVVSLCGSVDAAAVRSSSTTNQIVKGTSSSLLSSSYFFGTIPTTSSSVELPVRKKQQNNNIRRLKKDGLPKKRDCKLETKENSSVEYECKAKSTTNDGTTELKIKDKIRYRIDTGMDGITVQVDYYNSIKEETIEDTTKSSSSTPKEEDVTEPVPADEEKNSNNDGKDGEEKDKEKNRVLQKDEEYNKEKTQTTYAIKYTTLIEYRKGVNSTLGEEYDFEEDKVIQSIPLTDWVEFSDVKDDLIRYSSFATKTVDGLVTLNFTINRGSEDDYTEDTTTTTTTTSTSSSKATVNKMKIDITIENFPWKRDNTYVALLSNVRSGREIKTVRPNKDDPEDDKAFVQQSSEGEPPKPPHGPKDYEKITKQVDISFDDAIAATSGFVTFGEYTWDSYAKVSKKKITPSEANITEILISPSSNDTTTATARFSSYSSQNGGGGQGRFLTNGTETTTTTTGGTSDTTTVENITATDVQDETPTEGIVVIATTKKNTNNINTRRTTESLSNDQEQIIAFSFVGNGAKAAKVIYWDPEAGIGYTSAAPHHQFYVLSGFSLLVASIVVGTLSYL